MSATILVVDDDAAVVRPLAKFLELEGFTTVTAANGLEALKYLRGGGGAAVIVLDLRMPVMDGWAFRREQLRDPMLAQIPVVVLSGADHDRVPEILAAAAFEKPYQLAEVTTAVRQLCTQSGDARD
ncbi:MAG TPA: response regulator [Vicinamibacterales bacterium]|jgi:CheY-like chemotaxis protein|nr:response regulator [Vicinamibacterales bacterium]